MPFQFPGVEYSEHDGAPQVALVTLLGVLTAYPQAGVGLIVRNFNTIEPAMGPFSKPKWASQASSPRMSVYLFAYLPEEEKSAVGTEHVNLSRVFPPELMEEFRKCGISRTDGPVIGWGSFLELGQRMADALKREVEIVHQYGGNMEYAAYDYYRPFVPGGGGQIEVVRHIDPAVGY